MGVDVKPGRPTNGKPIEHTAVSKITRCNICGSTQRDAYNNTREIEQGGVNDDGVYTHVVWRNTKCSKCGQSRIDKAYENRNA